jgi:hypothetical protein
MTTPEALNELADRVEREEPSRELEVAIAFATGQKVEERRATGWATEPYYVIHWQAPHVSAGMREPLPRWLSSLDAAVTLVPWNAVSWFTLQRAENGDWLPEIYLKGSGLAADGFTGADGIKTAAHALVPVALRARAADMQARAGATSNSPTRSP